MSSHGTEGLKTLRRLVEATSSATGQAFYDALVENLSSALGVRYAFVAKLTGPEQRRTETLAAWWNGKPRATFGYALDDTPCETVLAKGELAYYPRRVADLFPKDIVLGQLGVQAYMGTPLRAAEGGYLGMLVVMDGEPLDEAKEPASILRIFADRAAAELQRQRDERRLRQAREHALRGQKFEALGRLAGGIVHDFNNLLAAIQAAVSIAEFEDSEVARATALEEAHAGVERAAALAHRLLAFAREQSVRPVSFCPSANISDAGSTILRLVGPTLNVTYEFSTPCWHVWMDPVEFERVLVNLVLNARDASEGQARLLVSTSNVVFDEDEALARGLSAAGPYVMISVRDFGCGMDEHTLRRCTEPFFSTKEEGRGSGLGLANCEAIVFQAGGVLVISSEPGKGTTVTMILPRSEAQ